MIEWEGGASGKPPSTVFDVIYQHSIDRPDHTALTFLRRDRFDEVLSYSRLISDALSAATGFVALGTVRRPVGLFFETGYEFIVALLGAMASGTIAVPIAPIGRRRFRFEAVMALLHDCGAELLVTGTESTSFKASDFEQASVKCIDVQQLIKCAGNEPVIGPKSSDVAVLQYTSGSTSSPKGVILTHDNILANELMIRSAFNHDSNSIVVGWAPHFHDQGLFGNILQPLFVGASYVLFSPATFLRDPLFWLENISRFKAHTAGGPNFAYDSCVRAARYRPLSESLDLTSWRVAYNGAEPIKASSITEFSEAFAPYGFQAKSFLPCYGLAECTLFASGGKDDVTLTRSFDTQRLSEGFASPTDYPTDLTTELVSCGPSAVGGKVMIIDPESDVHFAECRVGEIVVEGPHVASGYWNRPAESEQVFRSSIADQSGRFLRTGDLGFIFDGQLFVNGRLKDLIIVRGRNIYPHDIERVCEATCDEIAVNASVAFDVREINGEKVSVVLVADVTREARNTADPISIGMKMRAAVLSSLDVSLTDIVLVTPGSVPRTTSGKVKRADTRIKLLNGELSIVAASGPLASHLVKGTIQ